LQVYHFFVVSSGSVFLASIASLTTHAFPQRWLRARIAYRNRDFTWLKNLWKNKEPLSVPKAGKYKRFLEKFSLTVNCEQSKSVTLTKKENF